GDAPLALAVVTLAPRLDDAGGAGPFDRARQLAVVIDRGIRRRTSAEILDESFLAQPILRHFERARAGREAPFRNRRERRDGHVLELVGNDSTILREFGQCLAVVPVAAREPRADVGGYAVLFRSVDMAAIAELRRGHRQHPAEL